MNAVDFVTLALFLLVVINPVSKVALISALSESHTKSELKTLARNACVVGFALLVLFAFAGKFILQDIFHIRLYSVQFAGGAAIFLVGLRALRTGDFFSIPDQGALNALSAAPIGMPMIAGPAAIAAVISAAVEHPPWIVSLAVIPGMLVNLSVMLLAAAFGSKLRKTKLLGPLVRIVGLFLSAIGTEMMFVGLASWLGGSVLPG